MTTSFFNLQAQSAASTTDQSKFEIRCGDWATLQLDAAAIRFDVFVAEQQVPAEIELDAMDQVSLHAVAYDAAGTALGTGRLLPDGHIGRMAVKKLARGNGVGSALLQALMAQAHSRGHQKIVLGAQIHALPFYAAHGWLPYGAEYSEANILHRDMCFTFY